jgi:antirestriction protein ArdC
MSKSVYEIVTERIIDELQKGIIPWQKPWAGTKAGAYSRTTGRAYSILNQMMLKHTGEYLTYNQCTEAGGKVKKGEKSEIVVFFKPLKVKDTDKDGKEIEKTIPFLQYYNVFHISQCEGIEPKYKPEEVKEFDPEVEAEAIAKEYLTREGIRFENVAGDRAFYRPSTDSVTLPLKSQFQNRAEYYSTLFHELVHSTGHEKRLNRLTTTAHFGNEEYSKEELVAEIGAASMLNHMKIETPSSFRNSTAYVQSWIKALKNDTRMIVSAAGKAEKAVNLILNTEIA